MEKQYIDKELLENYEDLSEFLPPIDNYEGTDLESEDEEPFMEFQQRSEPNNSVTVDLVDEIENAQS